MLKRQKQELPNFIEQELINNGTMEDFLKRPAYQQNDYLSWISRGAKEETKKKRLKQMINELKVGGVYMKMDHPVSRK